MSRIKRSKQPSKTITKENVADSLDTKGASKIQPAGSKLKITKGNDKLLNANIICTLRSPVLQDRTNLTLEPTKVLLKKGKNGKADSEVTRFESKRTRSSKLTDDEESKNSAVKTVKKKCSPLVVVNSKEKENRRGRKIKDSIPSGPIKITNSVGKIKNFTDNLLTNDINSVETNKKNTMKVTSEQKIASDVNTKDTKRIIPNSILEPPSKRIVKSKLTSPTSKGLKQTKICTVKLRKPVTDSKESVKSSKNMGEQKQSTVRLVTRSKTKEDQDDLNSPSTATENPEKFKERLITQSKKDVNAADKIDDELILSQNTQGSSKPKRQTRQSSKDLSLKKTQQKLSPRVKNDASNKKFFKNKPTIAHSKISPYKRAVIGLERKNTRVKKARIITVPRESSSFRLRQTTLKESFSNCAKKSLRPRTTNKNYCEMSQIIEKKLPSPKTGPIYKRTALNESPKKDKEQVYDFIVDNNGSNLKRKKKRVVRKAPIKKIKTVLTKNKIDAIPAVKSNNNIKAAKPIKTALNNNKHSDNDKKVHSEEPVPGTSVKPSSNISTALNNRTIEVVAEIYSPPTPDIEHGTTDIQSQEAVKLPRKEGPKITSDHKLLQRCRINITGTPLQPKSKEEEFSRPFRATNAFNMKPSMQVKTMMDHSLIRRSLSPISKANTPAYIEDIGSPWRPIIPSTFSRVKNVFQSTPQGEKFMSITAKTALGSNKQLFNAKMNKIVEQKNENEVSKNHDSPVKGSNNTSKSPIKKLKNNSKSPRTFGADISNINVIDENKNQRSPTKSPHKLGLRSLNTNKRNVPQLSPTKNNPQRLIEAENSPSIIEISRSSVSNNVPNYNEIIEDKENSAPNEQNSRETVQAQSPNNRQQAVIPQSPVQNIEEFEPQPGPSGLQKSHSPIDTWNLKQTNLNKFLNLPDMPERTRISTVQGIFDDAHSTPITGKGVKKLAAQLDVVDAFGFDESDNSFEEIDNISPIQRELVLPPPKVPIKKLKDSVKTNIPQVNKNVSTNPIRISIGEIKKSLQNNANKNNGEKVNAEEQIPIVNQMPHISSKKDVVQAINFSDTFDVTNEEKNTQDIEETIKEVPLFVDLEPVHFNQPPRYSYKRKRHVQFNTENESEQEDEEINRKPPQKKKRIGKAEREQNKKLNDWAKNINQTFEEIDHFNLIVE